MIITPVQSIHFATGADFNVHPIIVAIALGKRYFKTILSEWMLQRFLAAFIEYWNPCASHSNPFYIVHRTTSSIEFLTLLAYI